MKALFDDLQPGDIVTRLLAGTIPMSLIVTEVTPTLISVGGGWTFDPVTGAEIDDDLGWGPCPLMTGSFLKPGSVIRKTQC